MELNRSLCFFPNTCAVVKKDLFLEQQKHNEVCRISLCVFHAAFLNRTSVQRLIQTERLYIN